MNRYGCPTTYKRIVPERGSGFILKRIYELTEDPNMPRGTHVKNPTKQDIYAGTNWANRPGWSSLIWSSLIKDGLIESDNGVQKVKLPRSYWHARRDSNVSYRAAGRNEHGVGYTVRYHLTPKGRGILFDMMNRFGFRGKTLNSVGSVAEHDAKKDECPAARDILKNMTRTDLIREYSNAAMEADRLDAQLLDHENDENGFARDRISAAYNNVCTRRDALAKEIERRERNGEDGVPLLAMLVNASKNQKLRAEKNDMNERLKKIRERLIAIGNETDLLQAELQQLIDWSSK